MTKLSYMIKNFKIDEENHFMNFQCCTNFVSKMKFTEALLILELTESAIEGI